MPIIADIVTAVIAGAAIGGSVANWCSDHHDREGCAKREVINHDAPVMSSLLGRQAAIGPCGVPQYNFDQCHQQLQGITVTSSIPQPGRESKPVLSMAHDRMLTVSKKLPEGRFENVPPACMDLAVVLTGSCGGDSARPTPCGSACLLYTGLTDADYAKLSKTLNP